MNPPTQDMVANRLLRSLSAGDYALLEPALVPTDLPKGMVLGESGRPLCHACFPDSGIASIVTVSPAGHRSEVGLAGREGMTGAALVLDVDRTPHEIFMQVEGTGYLIESDALVEACQASRSLQAGLLRYVQTQWVQTCFTALSNATHTIEVRLSRWLLMGHDRVEADEIPLTHEFLSLMLAVERTSVTLALHRLEGEHLIWSKRGRVIVRDREGLERVAADAYGGAEDEYQRLIGPLRHAPSRFVERRVESLSPATFHDGAAGLT